MKLFDFQDCTHNTEFGTSRGRTVFNLLEKLAGNQNLDILRILAPPEILVLLEFLQNLRGTLYAQLNSFPITDIKKVFTFMIQ